MRCLFTNFNNYIRHNRFNQVVYVENSHESPSIMWHIFLLVLQASPSLEKVQKSEKSPRVQLQQDLKKESITILKHGAKRILQNII